MFWLIVVFLLICILPDSLERPNSANCTRSSESKLWWDAAPTKVFGCDILEQNNEQCGVCTMGTNLPNKHNICFIMALGWKYYFYADPTRKESGQVCIMMDHCQPSWYQPNLDLNHICGTVLNGKHVQRGECKTVYGTYICECQDKYQGRNCNDEGPEGAYATGVQALLEAKVRVSDILTILIAVKHKGDDLKVHVHNVPQQTTLTITEPIINDVSSRELIKYCEKNTGLKKHCATYLKGSTSIYSVNLRFPLKRDSSVYYYMVPEDYPGYPVGYYQELEITTTNTINGEEKESFFRTNYDRKYKVFVQYPLDIGCYKNVKITNCEEIKGIVNVYDASQEFLAYGENPDNKIHEKNNLKCSSNGDETVKWKILRIMPNGQLYNVDEFKGENAFEYFIKPYTFLNGMYILEFSYSMLTTYDKRENFDQCIFTVVEAPLVAIIEGGSTRYVDVDAEIILDGSRSYDPNLPGEKKWEGLNFHWSCILNKTRNPCLKDDLPSSYGLQNKITLPPSVLEDKQEYVITLAVTKVGKTQDFTYQTLVAGRNNHIQSLNIICINCMAGYTANPTDYIYLLVRPVFKPNVIIESPLNYSWTFSTFPKYPPDTSTDSIRVNQTGQDLLKIGKNKLKHNTTYIFRAAITDTPIIFAEININTSFINNFTCTLTPDSGIVAVTNFSLNCSKNTGLTFEVYDKSLSDPNYFSGRMLFTNVFRIVFKLENIKLVVYGYNKFKMIQELVLEVKLTPFDGKLKDIDDMVLRLNDITRSNNQSRLNSASVIPSALSPEMEWSSIDLLKRLISFVYQTKFQAMLEIKLVLSSVEFILVVLSKNDTKKEFKLQVEEAKVSADIISALASSLFERVKMFDDQVTLTETILHQMIRSHLNMIEIVSTVRNDTVLSKPFYLVNPYVLYVVKVTTYKLVDALYKLSASLLWRQVQGDSATEIDSTGFQLTQWALVNNPKVLYHMRRQNQSIPYNFSFGFYQIMKNLDTLGIQVTTLYVNPFWWAGGDINTNILLVDICFKVNLTKCKYQRTFYKAPIFLYFNISQTYNSIKPLEMHTVNLNLTKDPCELDLDITVYRFDPPLRAKMLIKFEFENSTENYKVLFSINKRPDFKIMEKRGKTVNNANQSTVKYLKYTKDDSDKLYYMGIYPIHDGPIGKKSKFKLTIVYTVCKTWLRWKWGSERCWVGEQETNERTLRCDCNHLSMFAGAVNVPPYILNPAMEFLLFLTEEFNWLPLIVLIIILLVFIVMYVWGWRKDRKDSIKGVVTILEDNYPGETFAYLIGVYTGSRINAGTDANVGIILFGENDRSRAHILKSSSRLTLQTNSDDWFLLYCPSYLGTLESIQIWHDNSGKSPDWFIQRLEVYDLTDKFQYIFEINMWLALGTNEYPDVVVATSSIEDFYSVRKVFVSNVVTGFRDMNYWTSIFWKNSRNPTKRVLLITVVLCYVMVAMVCSVIFYHFNKGEEYEEDEPSYKLDYTDLIIFIITLCLASFPAWFVMFLFRKSYSHKYRGTQSSLFIRNLVKSKTAEFDSINNNENNSPTNESKNLAKLSTVSLYNHIKPQYLELSNKNLDERFISFGLRSKRPSERSMCENIAAAVHAIVRGNTLVPVRLPKNKNNVILRKKYFITAWILFIVILVAAIVTVILFGHRIPQVESEKWVTVFLCVILFDVLILSTLKILVCSIILGCFFLRLVPALNYQIKPADGIQRNLIGDENHLYKLAHIRSHPMYCPLNEKLKELNRQKFLLKEQWKRLIDYLVVVLLLLVLVMLTSLFTVSLYSSNAHAAWMLTKGPSINYQSFTNIYNRTLYSQFLLYNFIYQLHRHLWYNQEDPLNDNNIMRRKSWTYDCTMRLLGSARIRQLRVVLGECSDVRYFKDMAEYCSPPWSSFVEDTDTYKSRWDIGGIEDLRRKSTSWRYTNAATSNSSVAYGVTLTLYPTGGYIKNLGFEQDDTEGALATLIPQNWLDHMTRVVFVELSLCNVNTGLFSQVILVAEQMPTGEYLVAVKAESVNTNFSFDIWQLTYSVFMIFLLVRMCILMNRRGIFVYFSNKIDVFEACLVALGFMTLFFYLTHITTSSDYVNEFHRSGIDSFFNFSNLISFIFWSRTLLCILFACVFIRMLLSWRFGRIYFTFYYTFLLSMPWIVWLVLYFVLYLVVIRRFFGYLLNTFVLSYYTSFIIYHKNSFISKYENLSYKFVMYLMCLLSYLVLLLFVASFAYYYKVAKVYKLIDTDSVNFFNIVKTKIQKFMK